MANKNLRHFIITGDPGVGKTTLTKKLTEKLKSRGVKLFGFYTEEVRNGGTREGFDVVTLDGNRGRLARDASNPNMPTGYKVGKYGVLVEEFEKVALPVMKKLDEPETQLLVIDEIGKMEFFSDKFKNIIKDIFSPSSNFVVLATIPSRRSDPIIESIRNSRSSKVWLVTRENRNKLEEEILNEMGHLILVRN